MERTGGDEASRQEVSAGTRWFVWLFLVAFVLCSLFGIEAWPLTGWRLFSHRRSDHSITWEAFSVDGTGAEQRIGFTNMPEGFRPFILVMGTFQSIPPAQQLATCDAWMTAARRVDPDALALRLYLVRRALTPRADGRPARSPSRSLLFTCGAYSVGQASSGGGTGEG